MGSLALCATPMAALFFVNIIVTIIIYLFVISIVCG